MAAMTGPWAGPIADYLGYLATMGCAESTVYTRRQQLEYVARQVGGDPFAVTGPALRAWFQAMRERVSSDTARSRRSALLGFYRWAVEHQRMPGPSPALALPRVRPAPPRPRPTPDAVWDIAWAAADERVRLALDLAGNHGLRRCEVVLVRPERDMMRDLAGWSLLVHGKGGKERIVPLTDDCARRLLAVGPGWAFPGAIQGHMSARWLGKLVNPLLTEAYTMHKLRHRAGTRWLDECGDIRLVADLLGHGDTKTTMIYTAVDNGRARLVVNSSAA